MNRTSEIIEGIFEIIQIGFEASLSRAQCWEYQLSAVLCFVLFCIANPQNSINLFINNIIDIVIPFWPQTPDQFTLSSLYLNISAQFPFFGWGLLNEILEGFAGIFLIYMSVKVIKLLPFL